MEALHESLLMLQELDDEIARTEAKLTAFASQFAAVEAPVVALERECEATRGRLAELAEAVRRREKGAAEKRELLQRYQDRMERVRNVREEAAARTEVDLIRRATEADEAEALELMEQVTRTELKLDELEGKLKAARAEVEPRRRELEATREGMTSELAVLQDRRKNQALRLEPPVIRLYERVRNGKTRVAIASLTADGACGQCFGIVPIQVRVEIEQARGLIRCEACGVILYAGS
jgi:predicted  nucleic acid-binding Zn-ribbon protein